MLKKIVSFVVVIAIVVGAVISYKQVDFGNKTAILFKIVFGDQDQMMQRSKFPLFPGGQPQGEFGPGRGDVKGNGGPGFQGPPGGKGMGGKPGMGKTISLAKVIPYFFILAFFILATRVIDIAVRRVKK